MRTCVIGAGLAGLAAARTLQKNDLDVVVYEKQKKVGGRVATVRYDGYVFDVGATNIAPRGKTLELVMLNEIATDDLVRVDSPIYVHESLRCSAGDPRTNALARYTYRTGNDRLAQLLSHGLNVRTGIEIEEIKKVPQGQYEVHGEKFDAVILTAPAPESLKILQKSGEWRSLGSIYYRPCLSVTMGYSLELPPVHYHALLDPEQRHPLTWLSLESKKSPDRAPDGCAALVVQMSPQFSASHFGDTDQHIVELAADYIERLYGSSWAAPATSSVVRWQYSQPESVGSFDGVNKPGARLLVAGDSLLGSRTEHAYESGVKSAQMLLDLVGNK